MKGRQSTCVGPEVLSSDVYKEEETEGKSVRVKHREHGRRSVAKARPRQVPGSK